MVVRNAGGGAPKQQVEALEGSVDTPLERDGAFRVSNVYILSNPSAAEQGVTRSRAVHIVH